MHDGLSDDLFNPKFVYHSPIHLDELAPRGFLDRAQFATHVDAAIGAFQLNMQHKAEECFGVRDLALELLQPVVAPATMRLDLWIERLGETSCVYGFLCSSQDGTVPFARGERTITKLDPLSHQPAPWSTHFRAEHEGLLKELPAYA